MILKTENIIDIKYLIFLNIYIIFIVFMDFFINLIAVILILYLMSSLLCLWAESIQMSSEWPLTCGCVWTHCCCPHAAPDHRWLSFPCRSEWAVELLSEHHTHTHTINISSDEPRLREDRHTQHTTPHSRLREDRQHTHTLAQRGQTDTHTHHTHL